MSETSERNKLSVRPKQRERPQPSGHEDRHSPCKNPVNIEAKSHEIRATTSNYELGPTDSFSENGGDKVEAEDTIRYSQDYVNPKFDAIRRGLLAKMSCLWCLKFFTADRDPRILHVGRTRCRECVAEFYNITPDDVKESYSLNVMLVHSIKRIMKVLGLFTSGTHEYSELERSIFNKKKYFGCSDLKQSRCHFLRFAAFYDDVTKHYKTCLSKQRKTIAATSDTINAIENCREMSELQYFKNQSNIYLCYSKLKRLKTLKILKQDEIEWIRWNRLDDINPGALISRSIYEYLQKYGVQWFGFFDADGSRRYCEISSDAPMNTMCISSFSTIFPKYSSLMALAEFFYIEPNSLNSCDSVYFEICRQSISGHCVESNRFYIILDNRKSAVPEVFRFLGDQQSCYLDAHIEVTEELIIFDYFLQNGIPADEEDSPVQSHPDDFKYMRINEGMVVSQIKGQSRKLTLFKNNSSARFVSLFGNFDKIMMEALLTIPSGRHKITGCGIGICYN